MFYTSEDGDTLEKIAEKFYGHRRYWQIIYEANQDAIVLKRGMVLFIPCDLDA
ncbi:LysM peptidoglycan-binding domain-containing protein [Tolypothrix sp. VBCCA 56010]|uniref:LysM peptidoglycan-binding domain-containing protein n=1 Tax=Tolypothrix sp. VBCCA 56010 TaxID=3137731 RepID=UPI003D7DDDC4